MKVDELRVLEEDELGGKLKAARRELYELRFKHAVGQLENSSQISKVRHDIARIMTVLREREFGIVAQVAPDAITVADAEVEPEESTDAEPVADVVKPKRAAAKAPKAKASAKASAKAEKGS
jgi:large subunit ribosomal protein L29